MDKNDVPSKDCAKVSEETLLVLQHCDDKHPPNDQYECGLCDRIYNNSHGLQSHLRRSHLVLKAQQKYTCMICKQVYTNTVEMMSHIAMHGGSDPLKKKNVLIIYSPLDAFFRHALNMSTL